MYAAVKGRLCITKWVKASPPSTPISSPDCANRAPKIKLMNIHKVSQCDMKAASIKRSWFRHEGQNKCRNQFVVCVMLNACFLQGKHTKKGQKSH